MSDHPLAVPHPFLPPLWGVRRPSAQKKFWEGNEE